MSETFEYETALKMTNYVAETANKMLAQAIKLHGLNQRNRAIELELEAKGVARAAQIFAAGFEIDLGDTLRDFNGPAMKI